jgi:hypothetical protein
LPKPQHLCSQALRLLCFSQTGKSAFSPNRRGNLSQSQDNLPQAAAGPICGVALNNAISPHNERLWHQDVFGLVRLVGWPVSCIMLLWQKSERCR